MLFSFYNIEIHNLFSRNKQNSVSLLFLWIVISTTSIMEEVFIDTLCLFDYCMLLLGQL